MTYLLNCGCVDSVSSLWHALLNTVLLHTIASCPWGWKIKNSKE